MRTGKVKDADLVSTFEGKTALQWISSHAAQNLTTDMTQIVLEVSESGLVGAFRTQKEMLYRYVSLVNAFILLTATYTKW